MSDGFDLSELNEFEEDLLNLAGEVENGKQAKRFLRNSGNKLKRRTLKVAKARVKKKSGNLFKGIKRGKPYKYYVDGSWAVRVYGASPHTHLLNNGHRVVAPYTKEEKGFAKGYHFFEDAAKDYEKKFYEDVQDFIDEMLDSHLL